MENQAPVGRFAPTPSGRMHLGNVFAAMIAWLSVRSRGGSLILRIEDLDTQRTSAENAEILRRDLQWLGLDWDLETQPQSQRSEVYREYFEKLDEQGNSRQWIVPTAQRFQMEPLLVVIQPHSSLEEDKPHNGEEFGYLMSGRLNLWLGDKVYHIKSGESFYYQASQKHRIENSGSRPAKFLWISTPPEF